MTVKKLAIVRGGGDLATGVIYRLWKVGYSVLCLETAAPLVVRRTVAAASAVFDNSVVIEDMKAVLIDSPDDFDIDACYVSVLVDPLGFSIEKLSPDIVVDAIMAKKNTGTDKDMAPLVIGIGPGFTAPDDVHAVIETKRGHTLGRVIRNGSAIPNTGIPGVIKGYSVERLLRSPAEGYVLPVRNIGDEVAKGEIVAMVGGIPVRSQLDGVLRGLVHPKVWAVPGLKIGDIDPRGDPSHCCSISDKALSVAGGVLEAIMSSTDKDGPVTDTFMKLMMHI